MKRFAIVIAFAGSLAIACDRDPLGPEPGPPLPPDVREYVTGAALANLDENGNFRFVPPPTHWGDRPLMRSERALDLAAAYVRTFVSNPNVQTLPLPGARSIRERLESQHGQPIDWRRLSVGPAPPLPLFVVGHLDPLPDTVPSYVVNAFGPWFVAHVYSGATPVFAVGVAAHAIDLEINDDGYIRTPSGSGNWFYSGGIPAWIGVTEPLLAEEAVRFIATETGARVTEIPVLGTPGNMHTHHARWQVEVDRPVEVERLADGTRRTATEFFVGLVPSPIEQSLRSHYDTRLFVAAEDQPTTRTILGEEFPIRDGYVVNLYEVWVVR